MYKVESPPLGEVPDRMDGRWFDEVFDQNDELRPTYASLRRRAGHDPLWPTSEVAERLRNSPMGDDARILPVPLVVDDAVFRRTIETGVRQRAHLLQQLFGDVVLGAARVLDAGLGMDEKLLGEILELEGTTLPQLRELWKGRDFEDIRFVYAPDLLHDPNGRWIVLEDNVGCVAGPGDATAVADLYRAATGLTACPDCDHPSDLATAVQQWLGRVGEESRAEVAALLGCEAGGPWALRVDENARRKQVVDELGIPVISRCELDEGPAREIDVLVNFDPFVSWTGNLSRTAFLNAPGTGFLGNKALLPFTDEMTRFYLQEEPILPIPETRLLTDGRLPDNTDEWVVKSSNGSAGYDVFILGRQPAFRLELLAERLRAEWTGAAAIAQRYVEHSRIGSGGPHSWDWYRPEIRLVCYVTGWQAGYVGRHPLGKAISVYDSRRLNNTSQGACYLPVVRERSDSEGVAG